MRYLIIIALSLSLAVLTTAHPQFGYGYEPQQRAPISSSHRGGEKYLPPATTTAMPLVRKQFYLISAPEDNDNQVKHKHLVLGRPQKNYRVVFIKAPSSGASNIKYTAEYAPQEEKTVIYVLSKKDNELDASDIATPSPTESSKPEVFFIKYKTPEEAEAAQKEIQNEYAKLEGPSEFSDEGVAPLTSIVGVLDGITPEGGYNYQQINSDSQSEQKSAIGQYLPPITK